MSSTLLTLLPSTLTGVPALAGQYRQAALYQALDQVSNGAWWNVAQLSLRHVDHWVGHWASVHWVASYMANPLSLPGPSVPSYSATSVAPSWLFTQPANAAPRSVHVNW